MHNFQYIFQRQWLEIEPVGNIVVGGDGFGIAIDHDGLIAIFAQRQRRVHTAIVEFNPLPDPVRATSQHHDFFALSRLRFAFLLVSGVQIGRRCGEFCPTRIDSLVDGANSQCMTKLPDA